MKENQTLDDNQTLTVGIFKTLFKELFQEQFKEQFQIAFKASMQEALKDMASKDDLKAFATKDDLKRELSAYATKEDLRNDRKKLKEEIEDILRAHFHIKTEIDRKFNITRKWTSKKIDSAVSKFGVFVEEYRSDFRAAVEGYQSVFENYKNLEGRMLKLELHKL